MSKSEETVRNLFLSWLNSLPGSIESENIILLLETAFTQGYLSSLQQNSTLFSISDEEKEALSGWVDLEEIR